MDMRYLLQPLVEKASSPAVSLLTRCLTAVGVVLFAASCSTPPPAPVGSTFVISARKAQFYRNGPAQQFSYIQPTFDQSLNETGTGPDFELPKGAHLTMLKREFGFSRVVTDDGIVGYVSNDQMSAAPAVARGTPPAGPIPRSYREAPKNANPRPRKTQEPGLDLNDVPLPLPG
jgi:hypothetical protein